MMSRLSFSICNERFPHSYRETVARDEANTVQGSSEKRFGSWR